MLFEADPSQSSQRIIVRSNLISAVKKGQTIKLPPFDPEYSQPSASALLTVGLEPNPYGGEVAGYRYQFEGEEDLLHLFVTRVDSQALSVKEGQAIAHWLLPELPAAQIWLKPGEFSQHFYFGHELLLASTT